MSNSDNIIVYGGGGGGGGYSDVSLTGSANYCGEGVLAKPKPNKQFRKKVPYQGFTRQILREVDLSNSEDKEVLHVLSILDDEGQAYVLNSTDSEIRVNITEGKIVHPSFFRIASFPRTNTDDDFFVSDLGFYVNQEAFGAIYKQEDAKLCLLLDEVVSQSEKTSRETSRDLIWVDQYEYDQAVAAIESKELYVGSLLMNPLAAPRFSNLNLRGAWMIKSVMVPENRAYLLTPSDYLGALVTAYGIKKVSNDQPETFHAGAVYDELISMLVLNPDGVERFVF